MNESFWWSSFCPTIGRAFSRSRAAALHKAGLRRLGDVWENGVFLRAVAVSRRFGLEDREHQAWEATTLRLTRYWGGLLTHVDQWSSPGEWVGVYRPQELTPSYVFPSPGGRNWQLGTPPKIFFLPLYNALFTVMKAACCLTPVSEDTRLDRATINFGEPESLLFGTLHRVRVTIVTKGPKKSDTFLFYGKTAELGWDPNGFSWPGNVHLMAYTTQKVRQWLNNRHVLPDVTKRKWRGILPHGFHLRWASIWDRQRIKKEAGLL